MFGHLSSCGAAVRLFPSHQHLVLVLKDLMFHSPLTSCFPSRPAHQTRESLTPEADVLLWARGFNNKSLDRDEAWAAPRSQSSRLKVRPHLFSFLMALFPTEDSPPGPTTMAPGPQNLLTAQLGPKVEIRHLWRVERRLSGPPRA